MRCDQREQMTLRKIRLRSPHALLQRFFITIIASLRKDFAIFVLLLLAESEKRSENNRTIR